MKELIKLILTTVRVINLEQLRSIGIALFMQWYVTLRDAMNNTG